MSEDKSAVETRPTSQESGTCVTCGSPLTGPYCSACGEKTVKAEELTMRHLMLQGLDMTTHFDFRFFRTVWLAVVRPGFLTECYLRGNRKPYLKPLQLFVLVNLFYFIALHLGLGANTFTTPLYVYRGQPIYGAWVERITDNHVAALGIPMSEYEQSFDQTSETLAKSLLILIIPMFAGVIMAINARRGRTFVEHLVFSTHFVSFLLIFLMLMVIAIFIPAEMLGYPLSYDLLGSILAYCAVGVYFFIGLRRAYSFAIVTTLLQSVAVLLLLWPVIELYRILLFFVCYWTV